MSSASLTTLACKPRIVVGALQVRGRHNCRLKLHHWDARYEGSKGTNNILMEFGLISTTSSSFTAGIQVDLKFLHIICAGKYLGFALDPASLSVKLIQCFCQQILKRVGKNEMRRLQFYPGHSKHGFSKLLWLNEHHCSLRRFSQKVLLFQIPPTASQSACIWKVSAKLTRHSIQLGWHD